MMLGWVMSIGAQDFSWMENSPQKYLPATTAEITSRASACNQGEEAFMDFIPKFRKNAAFRNKRVQFSEDDSMGKMGFECFDNFAIFKAIKKNTKCDKSYGTWFNISADEVCFVYNDVLPCYDCGGGTIAARFQRIGGKWYMTGFMAAG